MTTKKITILIINLLALMATMSASAYENVDTVSYTDSLTIEKDNVKISQLPDIVVSGHKNGFLYVTALVREYSTLMSYTDTVKMFREKIVDFMLPNNNKNHSAGWLNPRVIDSKSYYNFTDTNGLDSVSDRCNYHFSWSDWIGIIPRIEMSSRLIDEDVANDTIRGRYSPAEIWHKDGDRVSIYLNILADTSSRKWVSNFSTFFQQKSVDFDRFTMLLEYDNVRDTTLTPRELTRYSFNILSQGRGRSMFRFTSAEQYFYVLTDTEVYILDKRYLSKREAGKLSDIQSRTAIIDGIGNSGVPTPPASILALISRVENIDSDEVRSNLQADKKMISTHFGKAKNGLLKRFKKSMKKFIPL